MTELHLTSIESDYATVTVKKSTKIEQLNSSLDLVLPGKPGRIKKCNPAARTFDREMVSKAPEANIMGFVFYVHG